MAIIILFLSFWKNLHSTWSQKKLAFIHSVGIADNFNANYKAIISFIKFTFQNEISDESMKLFVLFQNDKKYEIRIVKQ